MNPYCLVFEVEPQTGNIQSAHVSRAVVHIWVFSTSIEEARDIALRFLESGRWQVNEELQAFSPTPEQIDGLDEAASSSYRKAELDGIDATFHFWHR